MKKNINDQVSVAEVEAILRLATECLDVDGDFVELGCYRGDTSILLGKLLAENNLSFSVNDDSSLTGENNSTQKRLWIYDSFAGLPEKTSEDISSAGENFQGGELLVSKREVVDKIRRAGLKNVIIKKAWFDELTDADLPEKIAFAFLDGDLYESIRVSLKLVVPKMSEQGIVVVHDYNNPELPGASQAVDEFLRANPKYKLHVQQSLAIIRRD